jgi:AhpD family alkylhydroperoxidase
MSMGASRANSDAFAARLPEAAVALRGLSRISTPGLDQGLVELLKVRVSQINGCASGLQLHLDWACGAGVPQVKLDRVALGRESPGIRPCGTGRAGLGRGTFGSAASQQCHRGPPGAAWTV